MRSACSRLPGPSAAECPSDRGGGARVWAGTLVDKACRHSASVQGAPIFRATASSFAGDRTEYSFANSRNASSAIYKCGRYPHSPPPPRLQLRSYYGSGDVED